VNGYGRPLLHKGGPVGEEGAYQAPGPHPDAGAVATTGDETLEVPGKVCPAHLKEYRPAPYPRERLPRHPTPAMTP